MITDSLSFTIIIYQLSTIHYFDFLTAAFFLAAGGLAGRVFPNEPLKRFPFAVFLSPLPMIFYLIMKVQYTSIKKLRPAFGGMELLNVVRDAIRVFQRALYQL
jgi:hypothetical protein